MAAIPVLLIVIGSTIVVSVQVDPLVGIGHILAVAGSLWLADLLMP